MCTALPSIGYIADVATYVFYTPQYKKSLSNFFCRRVERNVSSSIRAGPVVVSAVVVTSRFTSVEDDDGNR